MPPRLECNRPEAVTLPPRLRWFRSRWTDIVLGLALFASAMVRPPVAHAQTTPDRDKSISREEAFSGLLLNCVYYGRWPKAMDPQEQKVARIGVLGTDTLGAALHTIANKATNSWFKGGHVEIVRSSDPSQLESCHVVFCAGKSLPELQPALSRFKDRPILVVGECRGFLEEGGSIEVAVIRERLVFDVNLDQLGERTVELGTGFYSRAREVLRDRKRMDNPGRRTKP